MNVVNLLSDDLLVKALTLTIISRSNLTTKNEYIKLGIKQICHVDKYWRNLVLRNDFYQLERFEKTLKLYTIL